MRWEAATGGAEAVQVLGKVMKSYHCGVEFSKLTAEEEKLMITLHALVIA